jgi:hypothetical protein
MLRFRSHLSALCKGEKLLTQNAIFMGIKTVWVNGVKVYRNQKGTGNLPRDLIKKAN